MKIIRDEQGRVVQVIKEEFDGDYNTTMEAFKMILECEKCVAVANRDITLAKSQEQKDIYDKALQASTSIIKNYTQIRALIAIQTCHPCMQRFLSLKLMRIP